MNKWSGCISLFQPNETLTQSVCYCGSVPTNGYWILFQLDHPPNRRCSNQSYQRNDMGAPRNLTVQKIATNEFRLHKLFTSCRQWSFSQGDRMLIIAPCWLAVIVVISLVPVLSLTFCLEVLRRPAAPSMQSPSCSKRPKCLEPPRAMAGQQFCRSFDHHARHPQDWQSCVTLWNAIYKDFNGLSIFWI